jgi:YVTN family beta-propeller protein
MKFMNRSSLLCLPLLFALASCTKDPSSPEIPPATVPAVHGTYILNEGDFRTPMDARLSLYDLSRDTVSLDVVESANAGQHLGNTADDMFLFRDRLYILMSGSENIVVVSTSSHHIVQSADFPGRVPHSMVLDSVRNRLYVSELYRNAVVAVDLTTLAVVDTVAVGANPQEMLLDGGVLYVCNSGYGSSRTVSVVAVSPLSVVKTLTLREGPTGITRAGDGSIVVACMGNPYSMPPVAGGLYKINATNRAVEDSVIMTEPLWGTVCAGKGGDVFFIGVTAGSFYGGPVHRYLFSSRTLSNSIVPGTYYGMAVDASSGDLYVADAKNFASNGEVRIYSEALTLKRTLAVQKGPAVFAFKL